MRDLQSIDARIKAGWKVTTNSHGMILFEAISKTGRPVWFGFSGNSIQIDYVRELVRKGENELKHRRKNYAKLQRRHHNR